MCIMKDSLLMQTLFEEQQINDVIYFVQPESDFMGISTVK